MNTKQHTRLSKFISLILRHDPKKINIQLDPNGWAKVDELITGMNQAGRKINFEILETLVKDCDKQRFRFNSDKTKICANQGHSLKLDLNLTAIEPPEFLYHGTADRFFNSISEKGLLKQNRHHVHLSSDTETAYQVGIRHGKPIILKVMARQMYQAGFKFYCSENKVWLTDTVPNQYFELMPAC